MYELYDGVNPADKQISSDLSFNLSTAIAEMGILVRDYLGVTLNDQLALGSTENAFKEWRINLEELGLFVFKDAFKADEFSGFCLYDEKFPIIYVNNSKSFARQIFTLFHELAHILFKTGGVDTHIEDYIDHLQGDNKQIEIVCNRFAGEFLVPSSDFVNRAMSYDVNESYICELSDLYNVSREVPRS